MARIAVSKIATNGLVAFFQGDNSSLSMAFQSIPGRWGSVGNLTTDGSDSEFIDKTLTVGDDGARPVFGLLSQTDVVLFPNTGVNGSAPVFGNQDIALPRQSGARMLALGSGGGMMVAAPGGDRIFALRNAPGATATSWKPVSLPASSAVHAIAMANSRLFADVPEAFAVTDNAVVHSSLGASGVWSPFTKLNSSIKGVAIAATVNGNSLVDAIVISSDGQVFHAHQRVQGSTTAFADWAPITIPTVNGRPAFDLKSATNDSISVARVLGGGTGTVLTVFVTDRAGIVHTAQQTSPDSTTWHPWLQLPTPPAGEVLTSIGVTSNATSLVDVMCAAGALLSNLQTASGFGPWIRLQTA